MFGRGGPRRGSHGDLTKLPESGDESSEGFSVSPVALVMEPVVEYGETVGGRSHHLRAGRPLFREFSF